MTEPRAAGDAAARAASLELAQLQAQIVHARIELTSLQADADAAARSLGSKQSMLLLMANERLVVSAMQAQVSADTASLALNEVSRAAALDSLTELPNRVLLLDRLTHAIALAKRHGSTLALLFLDLDEFKEINDAHGHTVGDEALKIVARCLLGSVREADTVSRHGGDEFLILLTEASAPADVQRTCLAMSAALEAVRQVDGHAVQLSASIGISLYPNDGIDAHTLIDRADAAMYRAKQRRGASTVSRWHLVSNDPTPGAPADAPERGPRTPQASALAVHEQRSTRQQEANSQLVIAALGAQGLQANAERAQQRQTDFMTMLAHELRNPLAPLRAAATLLGRVHSDEPLMLRLQIIIERQVVNMTRLVGDLLDVSRAKTGKLRLERTTVDFTQLLSDAVDAGRPTTDARQQRFTVDLPTSPVFVDGDALRLSQIVGNLLDNASKYTPNGGDVALRVTADVEQVVMTVSDTGIGITSQTLAEVFEPFVQDAHAIGFNGAGLGIGLTVVRELVEAHGGTVTASSDGPHTGSRFVVTLPRLVGEGGRAPHPKSA